MTKTDRHMAFTRLAKAWVEWLKMNDAQLFAEAKKILPLLSSATRDECFMLLSKDLTANVFFYVH
jgi:hypothetical protein